jgi:hypothetical protein
VSSADVVGGPGDATNSQPLPRSLSNPGLDGQGTLNGALGAATAPPSNEGPDNTQGNDSDRDLSLGGGLDGSASGQDGLMTDAAGAEASAGGSSKTQGNARMSRSGADASVEQAHSANASASASRTDALKRTSETGSGEPKRTKDSDAR